MTYLEGLSVFLVALGALLHWFQRKRYLAPKPQSAGLTSAQIDNACLWYRHDYGLMAEGERRYLRAECVEWHNAIQKVKQ